MNSARFSQISHKYPALKVAIVGDFCLDRYLEIDPEKAEISIETGLPVHNVVSVRAQPGGAGTVLNNLVALGIGEIYVVGMCGLDGEGWELQQALQRLPGVKLDHFLASQERRTFTYTKPLVIRPGQPPQELNRLDLKNWLPTPASISNHFCSAIQRLANQVDAIMLLEQVDIPDTGVLTQTLLSEIGRVSQAKPGLLILGDSRRGLRHFPPVSFKMNAAELKQLLQVTGCMDLAETQKHAVLLARRNQKPVFVTLAEQGIVGADTTGNAFHVASLPLRGEIDIVGAGDAVSANLLAAMAAGATVHEAIAIANLAASVVIHQLGTTGSASVNQINMLLT